MGELPQVHAASIARVSYRILTASDGGRRSATTMVSAAQGAAVSPVHKKTRSLRLPTDAPGISLTTISSAG